MLYFLLPLLALSAAADEFVRIQGTQFTLNGRAFRFQGSSQREAAIHLKENEIKSLFEYNRKQGIKVVRIWAFNEADCGITGCFASERNGRLIINDKALERLDQVLHYASLNSIKLTMVPVNYETSFGGFQWWVDNFDGPGKPKENFYTPKVQKVFRQYLTALANRKNTINGRIYKDDPTIMSWNTANGPHTSDNADITGRISSRYICETAGFLKHTLNVKQLVSSGEEGYRTTGGPFSQTDQKWVDNGIKGVDFATNVKCKNLDYATVHLYPDNWKVPVDSFKDFVNKFLKDRAALARQQRKPLVVEEFGCCLAQEYQGRRAEMFRHYLDAFRANNIAGQLVWQVFPNDSPLWVKHGDKKHYDFTFSSDPRAFGLLKAEISRLQ